MLIDHVGIDVTDLQRSKAFYLAALKPLGVGVVQEVPDAVVGLGSDEDDRDIQHGKSTFWIAAGKAPITPVHVAFGAKDHATVQAFHAAAVAAGGKDNGAPGFRPQYHPGYYAAFVLDPDGHNVEAVCHTPQ